MKAAAQDSEWCRLHTGPNAEVWIHARCAEELEGLNDKDRAKIVACMTTMYCQLPEPLRIPPERLNGNEGWYTDGEKKYRLQAFKHHQGRVYGIQGSVDGKRAFFAASAAVKKKNKADPRELDRAGKRAVRVPEFVSGAKI